MEKLYQRQSFWLICAIGLFLLIQLPFLEDMRSVMYDEAWYANPAYNLATGKGLKNTIVGIGGNSNFLLPVITSRFMLLFGYNLTAIRLASVTCGLLALLFLFGAIRQTHTGWKALGMTLLLFVSLPLFNTAFRFGRPECASLMCMFGGIWFFLRYLEKSSWWNVGGMSVFALLSGCAHPFSLLFFLLVGMSLAIEHLMNRDWAKIMHLVVFLIAGIAALLMVATVSTTYNDMLSYSDRFSASNVNEGVPVYFKELIFSKTSISALPMLLVCLLGLRAGKSFRVLAIIALLHLIIFPFIFSTDLAMIGLGLNYFILIGIVLFVPFAEKLSTKKWGGEFITVCCLGYLSLSVFYNYKVKYEPVNSALAEILQETIPKGSKVFGPIRQWPMLMETEYVSDHAKYDIGKATDYDYVITNSQDIGCFPVYQEFIPVLKDHFDLISEKQTRQYGLIQVYRKKAE